MQRLVIIIIVCTAVWLTGCAPVLPNYSIQPPWNRILSDNDQLPFGTTLAIKVTGQTDPLIGNETLTEKNIKDIAQGLLERRGFKVADNANSYTMNILTKTVKEVRNVSITSATSSAYQSNYWYSANASNYGLGVLMAAAVMSAQAANNTVTNAQYDVVTYNHTLAVEIYNNSKALVWKADISWNSRELDIIDQSLTALQKVFSTLPTDDSVAPNVPKLKEARFKDYSVHIIGRRVYHSPAVPYAIRFNADIGNDGLSFYGVKDKKAMLAYVDLLQTAEYTLPGLNENNWSDPMDPYIWKDIVLGGRYTLGDDKEPVNVMITLKSNEMGYLVTKCQVVTDVAYDAYLSRLGRWKEILSDYYDFYED